MWIFISFQMIITIAVISMALILQNAFNPPNISWFEIHINRESQKAFHVQSACKQFWLPKSSIKSMKIKKGKLLVRISPRWID